AGFRAVATAGIDLPVLNVFRMFGKMPHHQIAAESDGAASLDEMLKNRVREKPGVSALAAQGKKQNCVLGWAYYEDDVEGPDADLNLTVDGLPETLHGARLHQFRIDANHSNAFTVWKKMGSPQTFNQEQFAELEKAGHLAEIDEAKSVKADHGKLNVHI